MASVTFSRKKAWFFSALMLFGTLFLALWALEISLRLYFHGKPFNTVPEAISQQRHPTRGTAYAPNSTALMEKLSFSETARINSRGIRGPDFPDTPKSGVLRILVVSDSGSFGSGVPDGAPLADQMQELLGREKYEVINFSVAAYSTIQELIWLREEGYKLKPSLVILGFAPGNDIQTNFLPLQILFQNDTKRPYGIPDGKGSFTIDNSAMQASQKRAERTRIGRLVLDALVGRMVQRVIDQAWERTTGGRMTDPNIWIGMPFLADFSMTDAQDGRTKEDYKKLWNEGWELTKSVIRQMRIETEAAGARFVIYPYVNKMQGDQEHFARVRTALPNLQFDLEKPERMLQEFGAEAAIPVLSMYGHIRAATAASDEPVYFQVDDEHMTARGHRLAAEALVEDLRRQNLLPR